MRLYELRGISLNILYIWRPGFWGRICVGGLWGTQPFEKSETWRKLFAAFIYFVFAWVDFPIKHGKKRKLCLQIILEALSAAKFQASSKKKKNI